MTFRLTVFLAALAAATFASATELITNGDFENPTPDGTWNFSNPDGPYRYGNFTGWSATGASGVWKPAAGMFNSMSGLQAGWAGDGGSAGMLRQDTGYIVQNGDSLVFKVSIGDRANLLDHYRISTYGVGELFADNDLVASLTLTAAGNSGNWFSAVFTLNSPYVSTFAGKELNVRLSSLAGYQASFDDVSVDVQSVPEPATISVLGLSALTLLRRRKAAR